ncbi:MAG TPA: deoxyguanosinetriphosphate triphosphohydrolase [Thermoanaerobacterales bacterium]|nr:deoxyguanosinetriphosphate triphosphohydrolase [Thermoanaerobacterales bacterium]
MDIRERSEHFELEYLFKYASKSINSKGRLKSEKKCDVRTDYQRDRDRIIHAKAFRRLKYKTQVFIFPGQDHYRTRLTHTLEVSQIARTIAKALKLNEDLVEAIALGHDLGHTPFGHTGEKILDKIHPGGFKHNEQSLRIVDELEHEQGLNLTLEVRDGILHHTGEVDPDTLEGQVVKISDRIAYINHDIDDAIRAGVITEDDLPKCATQIFGETHSERINSMVNNLIRSSYNQNTIKMDEIALQIMAELWEFLFTNVYEGTIAKRQSKKAQHILQSLYFYFCSNPDKLPEDYHIENTKDLLERKVCDYIAGMTDRYAINIYNEIFCNKNTM